MKYSNVVTIIMRQMLRQTGLWNYNWKTDKAKITNKLYIKQIKQIYRHRQKRQQLKRRKDQKEKKRIKKK